MGWKALLIAAFWLGATVISGLPLNCRQAFESGDYNSGEKVLYTSSGASYNAWCWYSATTNKGLMYLSKDAIGKVWIDFSQLDVDTSRVALTFFNQTAYSDDSDEDYPVWHAYKADLRRIDGKDVTVLHSSSAGFTSPQNAATSQEYLFLGILRNSEADVMSTQGFQLNWGECTFQNCDANPNSYFAFFPESLSTPTYNGGFLHNCLASHLELDADISGIPDNYRFTYEAHFGGCGAQVTTDNLNDYTAGTIGLWFSYTEKNSAL